MRFLTHVLALVIGLAGGYYGKTKETTITTQYKSIIKKLTMPTIVSGARASTLEDDIKQGPATFQIAVPFYDKTGTKWECVQSIRTIGDFENFDKWKNPPAQKFKPIEPEPIAPVEEPKAAEPQQ